MNRIFAACLLILAAPLAVQGVDLQSTPVQDAMMLSLQSQDWSDDFDDSSRKSGDTARGRDETSLTPQRKSTVKAALLSALIPGAGEFYLGNRKKARYFFAAEALTWVGFFAFKVYGNWKEDDFVRFAQSNANAHLADKSDEFRDLVGFYTSIDEYNNFGRVFDPERAYLFDTPENHWRWQSDQDRLTYRHLKNRAREADRRADFMLGVAVVDRIISVIDAIRDGQRLSKQISTESFTTRNRPDMKLSINPFATDTQIKLTFFTDFN